jgi:glycine hydroxymethyltransferase
MSPAPESRTSEGQPAATQPIRRARIDVEAFARRGVELLRRDDPELYRLIEAEYERQASSLALVASCSTAHPSVLACEGTFTSNVTAEGYPGHRHHAGCKYVDQFEQLAIDRAKALFGAQYANVQPHSASTANQIVTTAILKPGDTLLGLQLDSGGHLSHGSKVNISGTFYNAVGYGLDARGFIDYEAMHRLALEHRPKLIICGTTSYPRTVDWRRFRAVADEIGAYLLADITHIAGLVIAGEQPNPIDHAHFTTTCTHKQLYGPRGGLILLGRDHAALGPDGQTTLASLMQKRLFPFTQGAPLVNMIVAKARVLARCATPEFKQQMRRVRALADSLAASLVAGGARVLSGGTDNHIVLVDVLTTFGIPGIAAEKALEECNIIVNKNRIPGDTKPVSISSGIRLGTNSLTVRAVDPEDMAWCADLIARILRGVRMQGEKDYTLDAGGRDAFRGEVLAFCAAHPFRDYPVVFEG